MSGPYLCGIYRFLHLCPIWLTATLLFFLCISVLHLIRDKCEGLPYNVSWASQYGDHALITAILIGCTVLQRTQMTESWWNNPIAQMIWMGFSILVGGGHQVFYLFRAAKGYRNYDTAADTYHNIVIIFLFLYLLGTILPVTFVYGSPFENFITISCLLILGKLYLYDRKDGRLQQTRWLREKRGIMVPMK